MRIFVSAGEPSGDLHGANLARALRERNPAVAVEGFGGSRMAAAGVSLHHPLADDAIMGFVRVVAVIPRMVRLLNATVERWKANRPDAVVLIDYPGFHWHVAKAAHKLGIPAVSFVPPQIWAWASHRVKKVRAHFSKVLCSLPFEEPWFRERGVAAEYVGHPFFDELPRQPLDAAFQAQHTGDVVALLPGSRTHEVHGNWPLLAHTAARIRQARPDARFLVACFKESHRAWMAARPAAVPVAFHVGRTPDVIASAKACVAVSGSVGLELLYRQLPTAVIYRTSRMNVGLKRLFSNVEHISIVNLLAGRELYPEYLTTNAAIDGPANDVLRWLDDATDIREALAQLRNRVARPGACDRAAEAIIQLTTEHTEHTEGRQKKAG